MNKKTNTFLYIVLFAIFMIIVGFTYKYLSERYQAQNPIIPNSSPVSTNSPSNGEEEKIKAPDFTAYDNEGREVKLSDYEGTPIVLNFWASWCPPCKAEMPHFNKVSEEYSQDELIFLMVDLVDGEKETIEKGKKFIEDNQYTFTVLFDTNRDAAATYGIRSIPSTLFIDKEGYIGAGIEGTMDEKTLRRGIDLIFP